MKTKQYRSLGLDVVFQVPESVEEFDQNAKRVGACLDEATNNVVYRGSLAEFRDKFCEAVETKLDRPRKTRQVLKDGKPVLKDGEPVLTFDESEAEFIQFACAEKGIEVASLQPIANQIAADIVFDASAAERKPRGPKKLAAKWLQYAQSMTAKGTVDKFVKDAAKKFGVVITFTGDAAKDLDALGWGVKAYAEADEKAKFGG